MKNLGVPDKENSRQNETLEQALARTVFVHQGNMPLYKRHISCVRLHNAYDLNLVILLQSFVRKSDICKWLPGQDHSRGLALCVI